MGTPENTLNVGSPYVRQVSETSFERGPSGAYDHKVDLPGFLELCVDVEGVPWVVARRKAPGLLADIERAKQSQSTPASQTPAQPQG